MSDPDPLAEIAALEPDAVTAYQVTWLVGEVVRLRDLLARLEWAGRVEDITGTEPACPWCEREERDPEGHEPSCKLAAALAGNDEAPLIREG